ncbi:MAG: 3-hydroxyacyl-ACP dehydratase FabZ [Acetobacteraceae bacterium]|nr:3-hydroxyacyl-ACP dehydratase FabZ [Acetobacteraceae bacterium]
MLSFEQIKEYLAQRFPLLMVDRVLEVEKDRRIVALKHVSGNEIFFLGHFPRFSILPGVLVIEAVAQSAALLFAYSRGGPPAEGHFLALGTVRSMHFVRPVLPGDSMRIEVQVQAQVPTGAVVDAVVTTDSGEVARGTLVFGLARTPP